MADFSAFRASTSARPSSPCAVAVVPRLRITTELTAPSRAPELPSGKPAKSRSFDARTPIWPPPMTDDNASPPASATSWKRPPDIEEKSMSVCALACDRAALRAAMPLSVRVAPMSADRIAGAAAPTPFSMAPCGAPRPDAIREITSGESPCRTEPTSDIAFLLAPHSENGRVRLPLPLG